MPGSPAARRSTIPVCDPPGIPRPCGSVVRDAAGAGGPGGRSERAYRGRGLAVGPVRSTVRARAARVVTPILWKMLRKWVSTVFWLKNSSAAICGLVLRSRRATPPGVRVRSATRCQPPRWCLAGCAGGCDVRAFAALAPRFGGSATRRKRRAPPPRAEVRPRHDPFPRPWRALGPRSCATAPPRWGLRQRRPHRPRPALVPQRGQRHRH